MRGKLKLKCPKKIQLQSIDASTCRLIFRQQISGLQILRAGGNEYMECFHCKGKMIKDTAPFSADRKGYHIVWEAVPAWVCLQCGEPFFESNEVDLIQRALQKIDRETHLLSAEAA